jgi:hypothetical protein
MTETDSVAAVARLAALIPEHGLTEIVFDGVRPRESEES